MQLSAHPDLTGYRIILELLPLVLSVLGTELPSGIMSVVGSSVLMLGSGIFVAGTGMVTVVVGIVPVVPGATVAPVVLVGPVVVGVLLLQAQAHRESAKTSPTAKMASFFIRILLFFRFQQ